MYMHSICTKVYNSNIQDNMEIHVKNVYTCIINECTQDGYEYVWYRCFMIKPALYFCNYVLLCIMPQLGYNYSLAFELTLQQVIYSHILSSHGCFGQTKDNPSSGCR